MRSLPLFALALMGPLVAHADEPARPTPVQRDMLGFLDELRPELVAVNQDIWTYAELGLQEHRSAARLVGVLKKAGFRVKEGVSDMPTAFVAEYGAGKPIIGILAEYDALPELSQQAGTATRQAIPGTLQRVSRFSLSSVASRLLSLQTTLRCGRARRTQPQLAP